MLQRSQCSINILSFVEILPNKKISLESDEKIYLALRQELPEVALRAVNRL